MKKRLYQLPATGWFGTPCTGLTAEVLEHTSTHLHMKVSSGVQSIWLEKKHTNHQASWKLTRLNFLLPDRGRESAAYLLYLQKIIDRKILNRRG